MNMDQNKKEEMIRWIKFSRIKGIGSSKMLKLLGLFRTFDNIYFASPEDLYKTRIFNEQMLEQFKRIKLNEDYYSSFIINICEKEDIDIIPFYSDKYPLKLKNLPDAPLTLYTIGNQELLKTKNVAIVGSRKSDERAKKWAYDISSDLVRNNIVIISGGAKGIDYEAHRSALELNAKTICVLGSGLIRTYPAEHRDIFERIKKEGLLISENPPDKQVDQLALVRRNRIISGLSSSLILVTSSSKGGSKMQLKIAHNQRIPLFCPSLSLGFLPNEGLIEAVKEYSAKEIININPVLEEINKEELFFSKQKTL